MRIQTHMEPCGWIQKEKLRKTHFSPSWKNSVKRVVFVGGIGIHLKTYHVDQGVSLGNWWIWFRVRKYFPQKSWNHRALFPKACPIPILFPWVTLRCLMQMLTWHAPRVVSQASRLVFTPVHCFHIYFNMYMNYSNIYCGFSNESGVLVTVYVNIQQLFPSPERLM